MICLNSKAGPTPTELVWLYNMARWTVCFRKIDYFQFVYRLLQCNLIKGCCVLSTPRELSIELTERRFFRTGLSYCGRRPLLCPQAIRLVEKRPLWSWVVHPVGHRTHPTVSIEANSLLHGALTCLPENWRISQRSFNRMLGKFVERNELKSMVRSKASFDPMNSSAYKRSLNKFA